jgi:3,4-dihydroxy-2-butanone 4-phosphate synthase
MRKIEFTVAGLLIMHDEDNSGDLIVLCHQCLSDQIIKIWVSTEGIMIAAACEQHKSILPRITHDPIINPMW